MLIKRKVNVNVADKWEQNVDASKLPVAWERMHYQLSESLFVRSLISAASNINCQNAIGQSPLMMAAANHREGIIIQLLKSRSDVNIVSRCNKMETTISFLQSKCICLEQTLACLSTLLNYGAISFGLPADLLHILIHHNETAVISKHFKHGVSQRSVKPGTFFPSTNNLTIST